MLAPIVYPARTVVQPDDMVPRPERCQFAPRSEECERSRLELPRAKLGDRMTVETLIEEIEFEDCLDAQRRLVKRFLAPKENR